MNNNPSIIKILLDKDYCLKIFDIINKDSGYQIDRVMSASEFYFFVIYQLYKNKLTQPSESDIIYKILPILFNYKCDDFYDVNEKFKIFINFIEEYRGFSDTYKFNKNLQIIINDKPIDLKTVIDKYYMTDEGIFKES